MNLLPIHQNYKFPCFQEPGANIEDRIIEDVAERTKKGHTVSAIQKDACVAKPNAVSDLSSAQQIPPLKRRKLENVPNGNVPSASAPVSRRQSIIGTKTTTTTSKATGMV